VLEYWFLSTRTRIHIKSAVLELLLYLDFFSKVLVGILDSITGYFNIRYQAKNDIGYYEFLEPLDDHGASDTDSVISASSIRHRPYLLPSSASEYKIHCNFCDCIQNFVKEKTR